MKMRFSSLFPARRGGRDLRHSSGHRSSGLRSKSEHGQSLVEFSLMAVALTILLLGVVDLGRAYFTYLALKDAAAEGSYFGSVYPGCVTGANPGCATPNNIDYRVRNSAPQGGLVNWSTVGITADAPDPTPGETLTVTVTYEYPLITPFVGNIVGDQSIQLSARSVTVILTDATQ